MKGLPCPYCAGPTKVVDSRDVYGGRARRRRRECRSCDRRFSTVESRSGESPAKDAKGIERDRDRAIRELYEEGISQQKIADAFGLSQNGVSYIINRKVGT